MIGVQLYSQYITNKETGLCALAQPTLEARKLALQSKRLSALQKMKNSTVHSENNNLTRLYNCAEQRCAYTSFIKVNPLNTILRDASAPPHGPPQKQVLALAS
jgi:predicted secreted protein